MYVHRPDVRLAGVSSLLHKRCLCHHGNGYISLSVVTAANMRTMCTNHTKDPPPPSQPPVVVKDFEVVAERSANSSGPSKLGSDAVSKTGKGSGDGKNGDKKGGGSQWWCPKCGEACTHVDTFVCRYCHRLYVL